MKTKESSALKRCIEEYIRRVAKLHKTGRGNHRDSLFDCPNCGKARAIEFEDGRWRACQGCGFILDPKNAPPSLEDLEKLASLKKKLATLKKWGHLITW